MRRLPALGVIILLVFGCGRSDPLPQSYYFSADNWALERRLEDLFGYYSVDITSRQDASAPIDYAHLVRYRWKFTGGEPFDVRVRGKRIPGDTHWPVCSVEIGPFITRRPFPVQKIYTLFDDAELARRVEAAVGSVDVKRPYEIEAVVDGFRVWLEQFTGRLGTTVNVVIDGCGRVAPRKLWRQVREDVPELTFPEPPVED